MVEFDSVKERKSSFISMSNAKQTIEDMSTISQKDPLIAQNSTIKECLDQWKDMPPKDMPNATADVASIKASHTPDVAEDVVNDSHSHTPDATEDVVNDSHGHTNVIVIEDLDVTKNVVNELHSHTIAVLKKPEKVESDEKLYTRISKQELAHLRKDAAIGAAIRKK